MAHKDKKRRVGLSSNRSATQAFVSGFKTALGGTSAAEARAAKARRKKKAAQKKAGIVRVTRGRRLR